MSRLVYYIEAGIEVYLRVEREACKNIYIVNKLGLTL